jgi:O-antigen ligase
MNKRLNLENLIYLTVFLLPLYLVRARIFYFPTNIFEIMVALDFFAWMFVRRNAEVYLKIGLKYRKYFVSSAFILFGFFLSAFFNEDVWKSLGIIKSYFLVPAVLALIAADTIKKEKIANVFKAYFFSAWGVAMVALIYLFLGKITYDGRLTAIFNSPNYLAMYLAPAIIIALAQISSPRSLFCRQTERVFIFNLKIIAYSISLLTITASFYFTYSYAAWLAVIFSVLCVFLIQKIISPNKWLVIVIISVMLLFSQIQNEKLNNLISLNSRSSAISRGMIWKVSIKILETHWFLGIGPGNFQKTYLEYQKYFPPYLEWAVPHPHNLYLAFWLSGGIFSLIGFLSLLFFWFKDIFSRQDKIFFHMAAAGIMVYILIHGFLDTTYFKNDLAVVFWLSFLALKE